MKTPARHIRGIVDGLPGAHRTLTNAQQDRQKLILQTGRIAMARYGRDTITMPEFSVGLRLTPAQIRFHYPDLDNLLGAILRDHIKNIIQAIHEAVPYADDPDPYQAARAAYFGFTRGALGTFNEAHQLFLRDRNKLPEDEIESVNILFESLAYFVGGEHGWHALGMLNTDGVSLATIEEAMSELAGTVPRPPPAPTIVEAVPSEEPKRPELPRHIRRKIEALRRQRQKQEGK
jgi:AcrR family transcriptional regulator